MGAVSTSYDDGMMYRVSYLILLVNVSSPVMETDI